MGWVSFQKSYVILRVGHGKCLRPITSWVGGVKKGQNHAYVIFEWSLSNQKFLNGVVSNEGLLMQDWVFRLGQESRREGWTDAAIMLCKLNKSL